ncbi:hypothetical protein K7432_011363 [Basidiobolus ranarum]|uniref:Uncharacterized protein n=1 Tax=Basidiobolus ranarum TaxID=34480 RepID=A0ABR2VTZ1_9FUNG
MARISRKTALLSSIATGIVVVASGIYWWYTTNRISKEDLLLEDQEIVSLVHEVSNVANLLVSKLRKANQSFLSHYFFVIQVQRRRSSLTKFLNPISKNKPIMTLSLKNVIVWNPLPDPKTPNYAFLEGTVPMVRSFARLYDIYLLMQVSSPEERRQIIHLFSSAGLFNPTKPGSDDAIDQSRLVFCQSPEGKEYIARNLNSFVHVDNDVKIIRNLTPFVKRFVWVRRTSQDWQQSQLKAQLQPQSQHGPPRSTINDKNPPLNPISTWYAPPKTGPTISQVAAKAVWSEVLASNLDHLEICDDLVKSTMNPNRAC